MGKKETLNPTEAQIEKMTREWDRVKGEVYEFHPGAVEKIQKHIWLKKWSTVYRLLGDIGFDEVAMALKEG